MVYYIGNTPGFGVITIKTEQFSLLSNYPASSKTASNKNNPNNEFL